jgi:hypothetical protein
MAKMDELDEIIPYISNEKCTLFFGAGFSAVAGCADWKQLVKDMLNDDIIKAELPNPSFTNSDNQDILEYCLGTFKSKGKQRLFWNYVSRALTEDVDKYKLNYLPLVKKINSINPFPKLIVTTNVDNLLEKAELNNSDATFFKLNDFDLNLNSYGIFYIHGHVHSIERSVFIRSRYVSRYNNNASFRRFLSDIVKNNSILFIGSSIEPQMKDILVRSRTSTIKHFMLVSNENEITDSDMAVYESELNVKVIRYGDRKNFASILSAWIDKNFPVTELAEPEDITKTN